LVKDDLQVVSTDHCPFDFEGQKELGRGDFRKVPNGLPGVEDRVDLLHDGGVIGGRMSRERWVEVISTAPAKMFGMYPRKGAIVVGADADLVVYDPNAKRTISAKSHHMDVDYSCYEGREVQGRSDVVLSRGSVIVRDGQFTGRKGHGQFIRRSTADFARLA
jgi:dihydropyrimidinase